MKRLFFSILIFILLLAPSIAEAAKKDVAPQYPSAAEQQAFTEQYWQAVEAGGEAYQEFVEGVTGKPGPQGDMESRMLGNLEQGKAADGSEAKGFHGDPNDSGPQDWSDWNIETDADGNVTGFKEKDFEQKDKDGDGEISDEERAEWDKKKKEEDDARGGPPGDVDNPPDWDQDRDGKPDPGFALDCYQCVMPKDVKCMDGLPGGCGPAACQSNQQCFEHKETYEGKTVICHNCGPKEEIVSFCEGCGYSSDPACSGKCPAMACLPLDVDTQSCKIVPTMQTREQGSTQRCYACMNIKEIEITYIVIIIETPLGRFVLDKGKQDGFKPTSIMALAKVDPATGRIPNVLGELKSATDFLGGFNIGSGPLGLASLGKVRMENLSGLLAGGLSSAGSFGADCFGNVLKAADQDAAAQGLPTSTDISGTSSERKKDKARRENEIATEAQMKAADQAGNPAISGPIVACGNEGREKVLKVYDVVGRLVDTITKNMLKLNPSILTEKLGAAQHLSDALIQKSGFDFARYAEKFTGLPLSALEAHAAQISRIKAKADQLIGKAAAKKKKGKTPEPVVLPNDPLYQEGPVKKKKKLLGILGGGGKAPTDLLGAMGLGASSPKEKMEIKDQWALREIGYTPWDDPHSAWNVVDANAKNIVVAVVDSGLDMAHEDAPQYIWTNPQEIPANNIDDDKNGFVDDIHGWNFLDENHDFTDVRGHGTFVAGIISAKYNNGVGIAGINPGAVIMPVKVANDEGETDSLTIYRGINYAVHHGAKVINVSLGGRNISKLEEQAVERAHAMGTLVVIAAGNNNENLMTFGPSSSKHALSVGQIDYSGVRSTVSNWGPNLGLLAPGEQIYSLCSKDNKHVLPSVRKFGYYKQDGTSFSTPMVAATASLIWAKNPSLTNSHVADIILATATDMNEAGWDGLTGAGVLNAAAALRAEAGQDLMVMFTNLRVNRDADDKVISVDVYGTVRGRLKEFTLEVGKGKNAAKFKTVAGPFREQFDYQHLARLNVQEVLRGSADWILRIKAVDESGQELIASTPFALPK